MFRVKSIKSKERKDVMKTQNIVTILMIAILSVLFDTEQAYAVTYGKPYRGATVPQAQFYSTGDITTSSGANSTPLLNENGLVNEEAYGIGRHNAGPLRTPTTPPPPGQEEKDKQLPIGDGLLPLLLCALAYMGVTAIRRRKTTATR